MTPLHAGLAARISQTGPITVAEYMTECLTHPVHGYYTTRDPLGAAGDFTTAPEISQMFGELIGLFLVETWDNQGRPSPFTIAELGPGRGTLMADALRATARVAGFHDAMQIALVEVSPELKSMQSRALEGYEPTWCDSVHALASMPGPLFVVANEYFDALPIRQFVRDGAMWRERMIGLDANTLAWGLAPPTALPVFADRSDIADGGLVEWCEPAARDAATLGHMIAERGGVALVVDYGDWRTNGDTFQAVCGHRFAAPLAAPGEADLTAHVDFEALAKAAESAGAKASDMISQGKFLARLGIVQRAEALAKRMTGDTLESHVAAFNRLTSADEMGTLFKAMAIYPKSVAPPPGFGP